MRFLKKRRGSCGEIFSVKNLGNENSEVFKVLKMMKDLSMQIQ